MSSPLRSTILVTGGNILVKAFAFLATVLLMRGFTPAEFGRIMTMVSLMSILPVFMDFGSGNSFLKIFPTMKAIGLDHRKHDLFGAALLFRSVIGSLLLIIGCVFARPVAAVLLKSPDAWPVVVLAFVGGFAGSFFQFLQVVFQSDEKFKALVNTQFLDAVLKAAGAGIVVGFMSGAAAIHGVAIYAIAPLVAAAIIFTLKRKELPKPKLPDKIFFKTFIRFSYWYMISAISIMIFTNFDYLILAATRPAEEVGYFGSAVRLGTMFFLLVQAINTVLMPYIGRITNAQAMLAFYRKAQIRTFLLSLFVLPAVLLGPWLVGMVAGKQYLPAVSTYYWVALDQISQLFFTPFMAVLFGLNRPRFLAGYVVLEMILNIVGDILIVNTWGADGVAAITFAVRLIIGTIGSVHVWRGLKNNKFFMKNPTYR
ncbi:oligosaccharide flippase family protein [bacterium]|nr:oligosaccharide flippase family protein [bacterium]